MSLNLSSSDVSNSTKEEDEDVEERSPLERTQPVAGTLRVRVVEARNLRSADAGGTSGSVCQDVRGVRVFFSHSIFNTRTPTLEHRYLKSNGEV